MIPIGDCLGKASHNIYHIHNTLIASYFIFFAVLLDFTFTLLYTFELLFTKLNKQHL